MRENLVCIEHSTILISNKTFIKSLMLYFFFKEKKKNTFLPFPIIKVTIITVAQAMMFFTTDSLKLYHLFMYMISIPNTLVCFYLIWELLVSIIIDV